MNAEISERDMRAKRVMTPFAFLLPAAVLIVVCIIGGISPFGNATLISGSNAQFIETLERFRRAVSDGESLFFSFSEGLGGGTWSIYSGGYFSPLYLISLLFPASRAADAFMLITLIRMGIAGFTSYLLTASLNNRAELCLGFSVAYGGCACFLISVFSPVYGSAAALLPGIGAGVVSLLKNGRTVWLSAALILFMLTSWQLWPAALFFTASIFVWGTNAIEEKSTIKTSALRCAAVFILALCASAVFAIPSMLEIAESGSAVRSLADTPSVSFPELFSGLFMGNEIQNGGNAMIYCSACTVIMLPVYLFNSKLPTGERAMAAGILVLFMLVQVIPALNIVFTGFTSPSTCESGISFMFCACAVAFAARGLSTPSGISVGKVVGSWMITILLFAAALVFGASELRFLIIIVTAGFVTLYAAIVLVVMSDRRPPAVFGVVIMLCILAEAITAGADCILTAKEKAIPIKTETITSAAATEETVDSLLLGWELTGGREGVSRVRGECSVLTSDTLLSQHCIDSFPDNDLFSVLGIKGKNGWTGVTDALFGVRYLISDENDKTYPVLSVGENIGLYENKNALSVGFAASDIILDVDPTLSSNPFTAQELLLSAALGEQRTVFASAQVNEMRYDGANCNDFNESKIITRYADSAKLTYTLTALCDGELYMWLSSSIPDDAKFYVNGKLAENSDLSAIVGLGRYNSLDNVTVEIELKEVNTTLNSVYFTTLDEDAFSSVLSILSAEQLTFVREKGNSIRAVAATKAGDVIFTTIPYSKNWTAVVDGKTAKTHKCFGGLMAISASEGQHTLSLTYTPIGFEICLVISVLALLTSLCYVILTERRNANDIVPEPQPQYLPQQPYIHGMESVEEGTVIPVVSPTLNVDLDFESEDNSLDWL